MDKINETNKTYVHKYARARVNWILLETMEGKSAWSYYRDYRGNRGSSKNNILHVENITIFATGDGGSS